MMQDTPSNYNVANGRLEGKSMGLKAILLFAKNQGVNLGGLKQLEQEEVLLISWPKFKKSQQLLHKRLSTKVSETHSRKASPVKDHVLS